MIKFAAKIAAVLVLLHTAGFAFAEDGCVIKSTRDDGCQTGRRLYSALDAQLNVCDESGNDAMQISGLYCRSPHSCFKDFRSVYKDGDAVFAWYNCFLGAAPIPDSQQVPDDGQSTQSGCVIKDTRDENCASGRRLYSKLDPHLSDCAEIGNDNEEIPGAYCKSNFRCYKDFHSAYQDSGNIYAWYNCFPGAVIIY
ncbi:MAG: hypothetical protein RIQ81_1057 [Pseudomonadota bacterium]